jgi:mRNA-degrading endonuclease toxin of MazEF toxin-antitoxin module
MRRLRSEIVLTPKDGMPQDCAVNLDEILTIPKASLESRITTLSDDRMAKAEEAIRFSLDLP